MIGGAALSGGRGNVRGTLVGAFVIGFLADGLVIVGVSPFWQIFIKGAVIILAVILDQGQQRFQRKGAAAAATVGAKRDGDDDTDPGTASTPSREAERATSTS